MDSHTAKPPIVSDRPIVDDTSPVGPAVSNYWVAAILLIAAISGAVVTVSVFFQGRRSLCRQVDANGKRVVSIDAPYEYELMLGVPVSRKTRYARYASDVAPDDFSLVVREHETGAPVDVGPRRGYHYQQQRGRRYVAVRIIDFLHAGNYEIEISGTFAPNTTFRIQPTTRARIWIVILGGLVSGLAAMTAIVWWAMTFGRRRAVRLRSAGAPMAYGPGDWQSPQRR
ncbi:MAG: hypothetical protein KDA33_17660, partial [Phycisphaerales bacterium]|nr:hypothetical protein [Phycisphaerales bacterium]